MFDLEPKQATLQRQQIEQQIQQDMANLNQIKQALQQQQLTAAAQAQQNAELQRIQVDFEGSFRLFLKMFRW